ncbi:trimeric intracellular cation channel family protein [Lawsonibacter sp. JLR.KK007]|uniref:trimeric intracellular cation channel family protein n=1 Tax=Lawsonibacter sp. JLR.KK007 TaxID=3114293 RepID=UPI002FEEA4DE
MSVIFAAAELIGTVAFAVSGALTAIQKRMDILGVVVLSIVTAMGGGALCDVLMGCTPPRMFYRWQYILSAAGAAAALFLFFKYQRRGSQCLRVYIQPVFVFCDALGLGIFSVTGTDMGIASGYGEHLVLCVCLGTLTGVGGGILRDIMCADIPAILCRNIYAAAALLGSSIFYLLVCVGASRTGAGCAAVFCTVALRLLAWHCHWNLPRAAKDQPSSPEQRKEETAVGRET